MRVVLPGLLVRRLDVQEPLQDLQPVIPLPDLLPQIRNSNNQHPERAAGFPAPPDFPGPADPTLNGRNSVSRPCSRVVMNARSGSTAKCTSVRLAKNSSFGSRRRYCAIASIGVLPGVRVLQLHGRHRQPVDEERHVHRLRSGPATLKCSCRATVSTFALYSSSASAASVCPGRKYARSICTPRSFTPCRSTSSTPRASISLATRSANCRCAVSGSPPCSSISLLHALDLRRPDELPQLPGIEAQARRCTSRCPRTHPRRSSSSSTRTSNAARHSAPDSYA